MKSDGSGGWEDLAGVEEGEKHNQTILYEKNLLSINKEARPQLRS